MNTTHIATESDYHSAAATEPVAHNARISGAATALQDWSRWRSHLACPDCGAGLDVPGAFLQCIGCHARFDVEDGIVRFERFGSAERWGGPSPRQTSGEYQRSYVELDAADGYNAMYSQRWAKRWTTAREMALLQRLLATQPRSPLLLDLPCGGGRLSGALAAHCDTLIEADIAIGQLRHARSRLPAQGGSGAVQRLWMTASGFHIPLRDASVDGVVCVRLNHHLPTAAERERLMAELLRVARRFVVMTFFDHHSPKNLLRRLRAPLDRKPPKMTMSLDRVRTVAASHGARLIAWPALFGPASGHRYALMVKPGAAPRPADSA